MTHRLFHLPEVPPVEWELLYDATCSIYTHPLQLEACAKLAGYKPVAPQKARILEIGSALGGNLNAIAESLPQAECIGIDPFTEQTQLAQARAQASAIKNVRYEAIGIEVADQVLEGQFDYIIAHGFFSWVSDEIRQKTFEFIQQRLSNHGICYVSYNTYPLWHLQEGSRHLMRWRARYLQTQENCIAATREVIRSFAQFASPTEQVSARDVYAMMHKKLSDKPDYYLAHEYILDHNHPLYFHQFIEFIHQFELAHLVDASFNTEYSPLLLSEFLSKDLKSLSVDYLSYQQYLDFIFNRGLRRSIIVK